jgi:hypothetical protein
MIVKESLYEAKETQDFPNNKQLKNIINTYKTIIYNGIVKIGNKYFGKSHTGFIIEDINSIEFSVLDTHEFEEDYESDESIVDDAYYLGVIFNLKNKTIEELPGYKELEGEQMTLEFVKKFYDKNKNKFLISYDASIDDISIINKPKKLLKKIIKKKSKFKPGDRVIFTSPVTSGNKKWDIKEGKIYLATIVEVPKEGGITIVMDKNKKGPSWKAHTQGIPEDCLKLLK